MSKVLLVLCPMWDINWPPLGISYLAASLESRGISADILDLNIETYNKSDDDMRSLWKMQKFFIWYCENSFEKIWKGLEKDINRYIQEITKKDYKIIGFSLYGANILFSIRLAAMLKEIKPELFIIFGGPTCSFLHDNPRMPVQFLVSPETKRPLIEPGVADAFVIGEGEETLSRLCGDYLSGDVRPVPGTAIFLDGRYVVSGRCQPIAELDKIPFPAWEKLPLDLYCYKKNLPILFSRGCINRCTFCIDWIIWQEQYRCRSASNILQEMKTVSEKLGAGVFQCNDLLFNGDIKMLEELAEYLIVSGLKIYWTAQGLIRKEMTRALLRKLKAAGLSRVTYGVESLSDNVLRSMGKKFCFRQTREVLKNTKKSGIVTAMNLIVGFPTESGNDFIITKRRLASVRKYLDMIGSLNPCGIMANSVLDRFPQRFSITDYPDKGDYWKSLGGENTWEIRKKRIGEMAEFAEKIGIDVELITVCDSEYEKSEPLNKKGKMQNKTKTNFRKFKEHLRSGGVFYAIWRGARYFIFLNRSRKGRKEMQRNSIKKGKLELACSGYGIKIFWDGIEITRGPGLNSAINTLGIWTDSSFADWHRVGRGSDCIEFRVVFKNLPLAQIWRLKIEDERAINWQIEIEPEEMLHIEEMRVVCLASPHYKNWINSYEQGRFPCLSSDWYSVPLGELNSTLVGVRFPSEGVSLPSQTLELKDEPDGRTFPIIQNAPLNIGAHIFGFTRIEAAGGKDYLPGRYRLVSARIGSFSDEGLLDGKIGAQRRSLLTAMNRDKEIHKRVRQKMKILLVNLPWQREGVWGVRAGSRWPHIKDKSEGDYLPFPFFLAYAASLLRRNDIEAQIIDAIAEQIPEEAFLDKILGMDFDYMVAETSVPSFYGDLRMLSRIHRSGVPIILCGPNSEIYNPQFLREHPFIDFVLYGEYEFSLLELIKNLQDNRDLSGVKGLIYRKDKEAVKNPPRRPFDINLLPWPEREQLPMNKYLDLPGDIPFSSVQMLASRGCPFGCTFCLWPQVMYQGSHYRTRDIKNTLDEMEYLVRQKGFKSVYFDDDTFNIGKERMLGFCRGIKERRLQNVPWAVMARPDLMDEEVLTAMKSAGLWAVKYGVESVSDNLLESCRKNMSFLKSDRMIKKTKELGIKIHLTFAFGIAGETEKSIQDTIDYVLGLEPHSVQFSILTPFPGTRLFEELDGQSRILIKDWSKYDGHYHCVFKPDRLSPQGLEMAKRRAYRLWGEYKRKKRGLRGDVNRFRENLSKYGFRYTFSKTLNYLDFVLTKKKRYLNGKD